jgi:hypothetical protein
VFGKGKEKVKFLGAQVQGSGTSRSHAGRVNRQIAEVDRRKVVRFSLRASLQIALTRATSSRGSVWLGQVIICTELEPPGSYRYLRRGR